MRPCWVRSLWWLFFFPQWLHFVGKSANSAAAFSWLMIRQLPRLHTTERMSSTKQASFSCFFPSAPFYLKTKKPCLYGNYCGRGERICAVFLFPNVHDVLEHWINIHVREKKCKWFKKFGGSNRKEEERRTCSEEEHSHGAVVPSLCPPAEGNQGHQKGQESCHGTGHQKHQSGNLPVCGTRCTQVRVQRQKLDSMNWTAVLTNTKQELIPQSEASGAEQTCTRDRNLTNSVGSQIKHTKSACYYK